MTTLLQEQKTLNVNPIVNLTIGSTSLDGLVSRYKYREKADSFGRAAIWLDNTGGRFNDLATYYPDIKRGAEVIIDRGLRTADDQVLTAALPTLWIESILFVFFRQQPYLVLDCIDWVGRLRYYRYASTQSWTNTAVKTIVSDILGTVGLTLDSGSFSTSLAIDFSISPRRSAWSALRAVMSKVPEVLYAKTGKVIGFKVLDPDATADYDYELNPLTTSDDHPLLDDSDVAESTPRYNSITVVGGDSLQFTATAEDSAEIALLGYRRRRHITDRSLGSNAECSDRAQAELDFWSARSTAGVIVARPHFTVRLFDVVSAPEPFWGGPAIGSGHVTRIVEWYNFGRRFFDQALTIGEVPDAALLAISNDENPLPTNDDDPGEADIGSGEDSGASDGAIDEESIDTAQIADGAITTNKIADNSISNAKMQNDSIGTAEIQNSAVTAAKIAAGAVDTSELASEAVTASKIADGAITSAKIAADAVGAAEIGQLPSARVYHNADQTTSDETETFLNFNSERWDTDSIHDTSTNNEQLTCPSGAAGKYQVTAHITLDYPSSGTAFARVDLVKNTGDIIATQTATRLSTIDENLQITLSSLVDLAVNDYVRVRVYQAGFGSVDVLAGSSTAQNNADFEMIFVGA